MTTIRTITALTVRQRRAEQRERLRRLVSTVLQNVLDGVATEFNISAVKKLTGLDPSVAKEAEQLRQKYGPLPLPGLTKASVDSFLQEYESMTVENPLARGARIWKTGPTDNDIVTTELDEWDGNISLKFIGSVTKGKGHATKVMQEIVKLADKHGATIELDVEPVGRYKQDILSKDQLAAWYKKFGFEPHEFSSDDEIMLVRKPKASKGKRAKAAADGKDIICDLDGTLCSVEWRRHFVEKDPPDWKSFFAGIPFDPVNPEVLAKLKQFDAEGYKINYVSARPDSYRKQTAAWLDKHGCPKGNLVMRSQADHRPDEQVKQDILDENFDVNNIHMVLDDRPQVIKMWKENGINVDEITDPGIIPDILKQSEAARDVLARAFEEAATEMVDPEQHLDVDIGTSSDQLHRALETLKTEFSAPDGQILSDGDIERANQILKELEDLISAVETKMAAYSVEHEEPQRSED